MTKLIFMRRLKGFFSKPKPFASRKNGVSDGFNSGGRKFEASSSSPMGGRGRGSYKKFSSRASHPFRLKSKGVAKSTPPSNGHSNWGALVINEPSELPPMPLPNLSWLVLIKGKVCWCLMII